ncbi:DUF4190 domain-containing protein [Glycomyces tenuis]|uniref:DUF4190 domain-containing protein n=1 Tax=Glycomyces tenuis TaxID=58116 RepID=UPI00041BABA5|nr:DUF4190 domain-containing protein [Glycomyces tenuis]
MAYPPMPPQQPGYQQPPAAPKNGMGTSGLVLGIIGALGGLFIPCIGWILGILAVIFGAVGTSRVNKGEANNKGAATTGLILGIAAIVLATLAMFFWADVNADLMDQYQ